MLAIKIRAKNTKQYFENIKTALYGCAKHCVKLPMYNNGQYNVFY